jgi:hypothetical protein
MAAPAPAVAAAAGNDEVLSRIAVMESQLRSNERLLREVLKVAADFFNERER